jgi:hypothetical protein
MAKAVKGSLVPVPTAPTLAVTLKGKAL